MILWHAHQNDAAAVRKLLEEDPSLVRARDYDNRTPLHVASLHGWVDVAKCLIEFGADVNAQDRWKNTVSSSFPALLDAVSFACLCLFYMHGSVLVVEKLSCKFGCFFHCSH